MSRNNTNNNRRRHHTTKSTKSISSTRSYASQLYNQSNLSRDSESPYETTTASTTASGTPVQKHHRSVHGSRRDKARLREKSRSKGSSSGGNITRKGDLAQRYNETSSSILHRHLNNTKPPRCSGKEDVVGGGAAHDTLGGESELQLTAVLSMGCDSNATPFVTNQALNGEEEDEDEQEEGQEMSYCNMITTLQNEVTSLLMSNPSTVQSLCSKSQTQQCELCCANTNTHPTVRCTILTQDPNYVTLEHISRLENLREKLVKEQKENDSVFHFSAQSPKKNGEKRLRNSTLTDGAVDNDDRSHVSSLTDHPPPLNFNTPLQQLGNEDNLPGKTPPPELNAFLTSPTGMHWEDLVRSLKKKTGLEALIDKELIINLDEDDVSDMGDSREGNKYVGDMDCMGDVMKNYIKDKEAGGDDDSSLGGFEDENDLSSIDDSKSSHEPKEEVVVGAEEEEGESSPPRGAATNKPSPDDSPRRVHSQRAKSLPRESLEKKIERVVTEQQALEEQEQQMIMTGNKATIIPLTPPPRSKSLTPRRKCQHITSGIGSAFSPIIKKNGNSNPNTPATTAMESTFDSSYEFSSSAYSSPTRRRGSSCGPIKFSPIEPPHTNSPQSSIHQVEPISPKAQRSPKRIIAVDVAPRVSSSSIVSKQRRAQRRQFESDPSDPPISINVSMSADEITTTTTGSRSNSAVADDDDMKQPLLLDGTSDEVMDTSPLPVEVTAIEEQVGPPLMPIPAPNEGLDEEDSFYQHIRGENNSLDVLDVKLEAEDDVNNGNDKDDASTVVPFPTSWDADGNENDDNKTGSETNNVGVREQSKTVLLGWVDDDGNVVYGCEEDPTKSPGNKDSGEVVNNDNIGDLNKNSLSTSTTAAESITVGDSLKSKSNEVEIEGSISSTAVVAPPILCILPESLSANRKNPTCWQMTRHRLCRTKGEF